MYTPGRSNLQYSPCSDVLNVMDSLPLILISAFGTTVSLGVSTSPFTPDSKNKETMADET